MHVHVQDVSSYKEEEGPNILSYIQSNPVSQPGFFYEYADFVLASYQARFTFFYELFKFYELFLLDIIRWQCETFSDRMVGYDGPIEI